MLWGVDFYAVNVRREECSHSCFVIKHIISNSKLIEYLFSKNKFTIFTKMFNVITSSMKYIWHYRKGSCSYLISKGTNKK